VIFSESPLVWKSREIRDWPNVTEKKKHLAIWQLASASLG
jgi:hypothetical protein